MDTKIEASYIRDEKFTKEFFSYYNYRRPAGVFLTVVCILAIISGLINVIALQMYGAVGLILFAVLLLVLRDVRVKKSAKLFLERDKEGNHGNFVLVQNFVTENSILVKSSLNESGAEYEMSCIERVHRSKNYIYLVTKAKLIIIFDANNFSKGTPEELIEFVRQKGVKIK